MTDCSCLFRGFVSHTRHVVPGSSTASNSFKYPVMYFYLDLDHVDDTFSEIPFVSINRHNILSWFRRDYIGARDTSVSLSDYIKDLVESHCNHRPDALGKVCLLTLPTQFGYGFNPVSIFYCFNAANTKIQAIVAEVHNTRMYVTRYHPPNIISTNHSMRCFDDLMDCNDFQRGWRRIAMSCHSSGTREGTNVCTLRSGPRLSMFRRFIR